MNNLYEKLYRENQQLKESEYKREMYLRKWKKAFGYDTSVSFDKVLEDLLELSHNKDYAKCKSIGCQFYDEKMEFNCCANESLCEKCMNSQHFA